MQIGEALAKLREAKTKATPGWRIAEGDAKGLTWDVVTDEDYICHMSTEQDAEAIALAANIWPELLQVVEAAGTYCDGRKPYRTGEHNKIDAVIDALEALAAKIGEGKT